MNNEQKTETSQPSPIGRSPVFGLLKSLAFGIIIAIGLASIKNPEGSEFHTWKSFLRAGMWIGCVTSFIGALIYAVELVSKPLKRKDPDNKE